MPTYGQIRNKGKGRRIDPRTQEEKDILDNLMPAVGVPSREELRQQIAALPNLNANVPRVSRAELERLRAEAAGA